MEAYYATVAFLAGLVVGSFLNVVIWRLPRGENLSRPRSHCPGCGSLIRWFDNVPLVSWVLLRGRCRHCHASIAVRYPLVELLTGVLFLLAWRTAPDTATAISMAVFLAALVAITWIDIDHRIIPDAITKPGMVIFIVAAGLNDLHLHGPGAHAWVGHKPVLDQILNAGLGCAVGAGTVGLIRLLGSWVLRKEAMGLGDVKLLGMVGAAVGPLYCLYALALACLCGAVIGGVLFAVGKRRPMPCRLDVHGPDLEATFERVRVRAGRLEVRGAPPAEPGTALRLDLVLPAARILEDEDARLALKARVAEVRGEGAQRTWALELPDLRADDDERLAFFAQSYRYIPFGPFLALGGALTALYGPGVHWIMTEGYPRFARSLFGH